MTKERFSNLTVLNSHKERTVKLAPTRPLPLPLHFKRSEMVTGPHSLKTALRILKRLEQKSFIEKDVFSVTDTSDSEETVPSTPNRRRTYDLLVTSPDAQPLSYRRLVRAANATLLLLKTVQ